MIRKNIFFKTFLFLILIFSCAVISATPVSIEKESETFKKAVKYYFQKKFEMAELLLQQELKSNPENQLAYSYLGDIFYIRQQYDTAINLYKKSLDLNPSNPRDHFNLGKVYYFRNLPNASINHYLTAYRLDKRYKTAYYQVGLVYLMLLRDKSNTISNWEQYLRLAPEDPQYEKIRRAIELLKDPNFKLPPVGSDIPIEEALHLGGDTLKKTERKNEDKGAGHEKKKTVDKVEDIYRDDDL